MQHMNNLLIMTYVWWLKYRHTLCHSVHATYTPLVKDFTIMLHKKVLLHLLQRRLQRNATREEHASNFDILWCQYMG
jgi:hypothetical protein